MDIKELQRHWEALGKTDPLWAVITRPEMKGNKWKEDDFFAYGKEEIDSVMSYVRSLHVNLANRKALDFGCGAGRLTQALASYFGEVVGVDIAPSMIESARTYNRHGDACRYLLNETADLRLFADDSFDFIYTNITLQHMEPRYSKIYIREFIRVLAPHGLLLFHLPSEPISPFRQFLKRLSGRIRSNLYRMLNGRIEPVMEMFGIKKETVCEVLEQAGAKVIAIRQDPSAGTEWAGFLYCATKEEM